MSTLLFEELTYAINGAAMEVHGILGPGFLEAVYQAALEQELTLRGIPFQAQTRLDVSYKGQRIGEYIADLVVRKIRVIRGKGDPFYVQHRHSRRQPLPNALLGQAELI